VVNAHHVRTAVRVIHVVQEPASIHSTRSVLLTKTSHVVKVKALKALVKAAVIIPQN
jgi:ribosomal protein S8E